MTKTEVKSKNWLAEFNGDWGRNITQRMHCKHEATEEEALEHAEEIKHKFGDPGIETIVIGVEQI